MNLRLATEDDLSLLKIMYRKIVENMRTNGLHIWNDFYPVEVIAEDIATERLYVLTDGEIIIAAFALCVENDGAHYVEWLDDQADALYIDRLGVNVDYARQGIGGIVLQEAIRIAKAKAVSYLRLFVVDTNTPAVAFYLKYGFRRAKGVYDEPTDDGRVFHEYGFELAL